MRECPSIDRENEASSPVVRTLVAVTFWLLVATLAWAPFPLGSNRAWSMNLLSMLIAACWVAWGLATWSAPGRNWIALKPIRWPLVLGALTLTWALLQVCSIVPESWKPALWADASRLMDRSLTTTISINPWRTVAECTKLASYALILVLAFLLARADEWAARLLNALLAITAAYSAYALALGISGYIQYQFFYSTPPVTTGLMSGPFVSHNSYATFTGMGSIVAAIKLTRDIGLVQVRGLDRRRSTLNLLQFFFGKGAWTVLALVLTTSTLFASASRAGVFATITSLFAIVVVQTVFQAQNAHSKWSARALSGVILLIGLLAVVNGSVLSDRLSQLVSSGGIDEVRGALWEAGLRMIHSAPLTGFGLGTFQDAYPQFADVVMPYVVDKAHNDYLELAAGLGLPAAGIWLLAWLWLAVRCVRGIFVRKRNRHYSLIAFGTSVLVAVHSVVDFSLQIPAIAVTYATLLGIGLAQSSSTRSGRSA